MSSSDSSLELRIKLASHEVEIKGRREDVMILLDKAMEYVEKWRALTPPAQPTEAPARSVGEDALEEVEAPPSIRIAPGDTAVSIVEKLFSTDWASKPKTLRQVMRTLEFLGVHYPKSTIAVTLRRLVKRGALRRIKSEQNVYVYLPSGVSREA